MHELFKQVLNERDLSRAGDLFSIPDFEIVNDLTDVIKKITEISSQPDYSQNDNDQSVVEICVTRVTSCVRETGSVETHCAALVALLEACLHHNLCPTKQRDEDPPHAKIASDVISCIFLASDNQNYSKKGVMEAVLPVAVKFLHKGNRELSRNMARYLSLAAIHHAKLLKPHVQPIMDSIISGNYPLCRVLTQLYEVCPEPIGVHTMALVSLIPHAEQSEKLALLSLFEWMACSDPDVLEASVSQLVAYLCTSQPTTGCVCIGVMKVFLSLSKSRGVLLAEHGAALRRAARAHAAPQHALLVAQLMTAGGHASKERAQEALNFVLECLPSADREAHGALLREATALCSAYPALFTERVLAAARARNSEVNQTSGGVTIVKLGGAPAPAPASPPAAPPAPVGYTRRAKLGDSRSTGRLHTAANTHRSMTRLNVAGGSVGGLHKSMTRLSSSQQINLQMQNAAQANPTGVSSKCVKAGGAGGVAGGAVTVSTLSPRAAARPARTHHHNIFIGNANNSTTPTSQSISINPLPLGKSTELAPHSVTVITATTNTGASAGANVHSLGSGQTNVGPSVSVSGPVTVTSRRNNTSVTMINSNNNANHRISVFEPYPMRDTVQHFCEKHLDKIRAYMAGVAARLPAPAKCTIEERRSKKTARLQFACGRRGAHCLFARGQFALRTLRPRAWVHLMFLALQARAPHALSSRDAAVASLKHCWDILKCENKTFLTLVTSAFPGIKVTWGCFLCNHPERAPGFLAADGAPVIEGQLKEKKGRWRLFRRWRTRYFTLSGAHLSCQGSSGGESIDINQIRSVKVSRGARNIPKAFEIFTGDQTLILKPKDGKNAEEWAQCLSIAVAHSQARDAPAKSNSLPARGLTLKNI